MPEVVFHPNRVKRRDGTSRLRNLLRDCSKGKTPSWSCKKTSTRGDLFLFYFGRPDSKVVALGIVADDEAQAESGEFEWTNRDKQWFCKFEPLIALKQPLTFSEIHNDAQLTRWWRGHPWRGGCKAVRQPYASRLLLLVAAKDPRVKRLVGRQLRQPPEPPPRREPPEPNPEGPLTEREDQEIEVLQKARSVRHRRLHNAMTNRLRILCGDVGLGVRQGSDAGAMFDALIRSYDRRGHHLLLEVKTSDEAPFCRMAVGQLLDYRRRLPDRRMTDVAVLFPEKPGVHARSFLADVGVKMMWFSAGMSRIEGDVPIGGLDRGRRRKLARTQVP